MESKANMDVCVWIISPPTGIRSTDRPGRSESLYRLGFPGHLFYAEFKISKLPYFSIDNAHLMYNAHPKFFDIPFDVQITRMMYFSIDNAHDAN